MLIIIQQPFIDFRCIKDEEDKNYFYPHAWLRKPFYYRYFGRKNSRRDADGLPWSEQNFFKSTIFINLRHERFQAEIVFTRLFTDDLFFHLDIGLLLPDTDNHAEPVQMLNDLFNHGELQVKYPKDEKIPFSLTALQDYIKKLYFYATTHIEKEYSVETIHPEDLYFSAPAVLCQSDFNMKSLSRLKEVHRFQSNARVYKTQLKTEHFPAHVWIMQQLFADACYKDDLRNLRICLLKLHNYREGLIGLFGFMDTHAVESLKIDKMIKEFSYLLRLLKRPSLYGIDGKHIMDYAVQEDIDTFYETWDRLISNMEEYFSQMKAIQKERRTMSDPKEPKEPTISVGSLSGTFHGTVIIGGTQNTGNSHTNVNTPADPSPSESQVIKEFFEKFDAYINEVVSSEVKAELLNTRNELENSLKENKKGKLSTLWGAAKTVLNGAVVNADNLAILVGIGEKLFQIIPK